MLFPSIPFHFFKVFSKNRRVEGNSNFEITISFHFYINFRNCYLLPFWLLFPSIYHLSWIKEVEGNSNYEIAISFHFLLKWVAWLRVKIHVRSLKIWLIHSDPRVNFRQTRPKFINLYIQSKEILNILVRRSISEILVPTKLWKPQARLFNYTLKPKIQARLKLITVFPHIVSSLE